MILLFLSLSLVNSKIFFGNIFASNSSIKTSGLVSDSNGLFPGTKLNPQTFSFSDSDLDPDKHRIYELTGLPKNYTHKMYSGHVKVYEKTLKNPGALFYWLVESQTDPENDPLLIWLNGGPGCSSMEGLFGENGPWWIEADGENLRLNEYGWNKHANVLYIDQPVGSGLAVALREKYAQNQDEVDTMFAEFLHRWFRAYPKYRTKKIWFSGESYAGHYIPYFVTGILEGRGHFKGLESLSVAGAMIGNGWSHPLIQTQTWAEFAYNIGLIGWQQRHYLEGLSLSCGQAYANNPLINPNPLSESGDDYSTAPWTEEQNRVAKADAANKRREEEAHQGRHSEEDLIHKIMRSLPGAKNPGRIKSAPLSVPECNKIFESLLLLSGSAKTGLINIYDVRLYDTTAGDIWPPSQAPMRVYLNKPEVRKQIHAVELFEWVECSGPVNRALGGDNMIASRPLIAKMMDRFQLPVLIYNGQFDLICNHVGTEAYLSNMRIYKDLQKFLSARRAVWNVDGEIAGYVKHAKDTKLTFLLINGGSHMVPMDKPKQCFDMINRFMNGRDFNDEETQIDIPFTPTVPYIPGDVVNSSSSHPHAMRSRLPIEGSDFKPKKTNPWGENVHKRRNHEPNFAPRVEPIEQATRPTEAMQSQVVDAASSANLIAALSMLCLLALAATVVFRFSKRRYTYTELP